MSAVYASAGGTRYHAAASCRALLSGQDLNDVDCGDYCRHRHPQPRAIRETTPQQAAADGKQPCARCRPPLPDPASYEAFGHEPTVGISLFGLAEQVCARCAELGVWYGDASGLRPVRIPWPCTTAVVLGLTEREGGPR